MPKKARNGRIEFYRFVFCMIVLLFHINKYILKIPANDSLNVSFFDHGAVGVEFFFILSGYFMAASVYKQRTLKPETVGSFSANEALLFMKKKYMGIFPQHMVAFALTVIVVAAVDGYTIKKFLLYLIDSVPNFFLVQMTGINYTSPNHVEWYISCMLIAMAVLYPVLRKYYDSFTRYVAPLLAILLIGHMVYTTHKLSGVSTWYGVGYKSLLRAVAEIALGTTAFELSRYMRSKRYVHKWQAAFTVAEVGCLALTVLYSVSDFSSKYEIYSVPLIFVIITICLSGQSLGHRMFNNKVAYFLGRLSLPIYLAQIAAIKLTNEVAAEQRLAVKLMAAIITTFVFALIVMKLGEYAANGINKLEAKFKADNQ
ncbi:MAG: acyltransferase [Ruminococcus sp.]|nr:acyltransferase [Ruminococcus sp.]